MIFSRALLLLAAPQDRLDAAHRRAILCRDMLVSDNYDIRAQPQLCQRPFKPVPQKPLRIILVIPNRTLSAALVLSATPSCSLCIRGKSGLVQRRRQCPLKKMNRYCPSYSQLKNRRYRLTSRGDGHGLLHQIIMQNSNPFRRPCVYF